MRHTVDYFLAPQSPWVYLGHARFEALVRTTGAELRVRPMDLAQVFAVSGGLPLPQRAPQRQAYRLLEMRRFSDALGLPLNLHPAHFPVPGDPAALLITAVAARDGAEAALRLVGAVARAVWTEERNIADPQTLRDVLVACGLSTERLAQSKDETTQTTYADNTRDAIAAHVFGAPSYVVDGELFWGQDRLDFVSQRLSA
jgi:2-hydroxychromene-2-carboxylate isomerase